MSISTVVYHVNAPLLASTKKTNIHSSQLFEKSSWWKLPQEVLKHGSHCLFKHDFKWVVRKLPKEVSKKERKEPPKENTLFTNHRSKQFQQDTQLSYKQQSTKHVLNIFLLNKKWTYQKGGTCNDSPKNLENKTNSIKHPVGLKAFICAMVKSRYIGDGHPIFNRNPYNGYINPYYWVDDHPLLYGNNRSLDPCTYDLKCWNPMRRSAWSQLKNLVS